MPTQASNSIQFCVISDMTTLYYDGQCPLCSKEMRLLSYLKQDELQLKDVHTSDMDEKQRQQYLQVLHLQTDSGEWLLGVDAMVEAWGYTKVGFLWKPLQWYWLRPWIERHYKRWAVKRYAKRYGCEAKCDL